MPGGQVDPPEPKAPKTVVDVVMLGDVGVGKSTLIGHLICKCGRASASEVRTEANFEQVDSEEAANGVGNAGESAVSAGTFDYVSALDAARTWPAPSAGGQRPVWSIDLTKYRFAISECRGDREHLKQLAAAGFNGAAADVAIVVVSAAPGDMEKAVSREGQTRELVMLARVLDAQQLIVCVTKMDAAANPFAQSRLDEVRKALASALSEAGFAEGDVPFVPISALHGDNLLELSLQMPWYVGPPLAAALDDCAPPVRPLDRPLRVTVREVYHLDGLGAVAAGCVEQGVLRLGDKVQFAPGGASGVVNMVEVGDERISEAPPRTHVAFSVEGVGIEELRRGMVASSPEEPALEVVSFTARVMVLRGPGEVRKGLSPVLACHATQVPCRIEEILARIDQRSGETSDEKPTSLKAGEGGLVRLRPEQPLCVEPHEACPQLGRLSTTQEQRAIALVVVVQDVQPVQWPKPPDVPCPTRPKKPT